MANDILIYDTGAKAEVVTTISSSSTDKVIKAGGDYIIQIAGSETIALTTDGLIEKGEASIITRKPVGATGGWSLTGSNFKSENGQSATTLSYTTADKKVNLWYNNTAEVEVIYDKEGTPISKGTYGDLVIGTDNDKYVTPKNVNDYIKTQTIKVIHVPDAVDRLAYNSSALSMGDVVYQDDTKQKWLYDGTQLVTENIGLRGAPVANAGALSALTGLDYEKRKLQDTGQEYVFNATKTPNGNDIVPSSGTGAWVQVSNTVTTTPAVYTSAPTAVQAATTIYSAVIPTGSNVKDFTITLRDHRSVFDSGNRTVGTFVFTLAELQSTKTGWTSTDRTIGGEVYRRHTRTFAIDNTSYVYHLEVRVDATSLRYIVQSEHANNTNEYGGFQNVSASWEDVVTNTTGITATNPTDADTTKVAVNNGNGTVTFKTLSSAPNRFFQTANSGVEVDTGIDGYKLQASIGQLNILKSGSTTTIIGSTTHTNSGGSSLGNAGRVITFTGSTTQYQTVWTDGTIGLAAGSFEFIRFTDLATGVSYLASMKVGGSFNNNQFTFIKL